ncbi:MAG: diacylglycerol kinase family lipid kinase, partial [Clostridia bacterium]|nr:diacylglycerol kinase family lipid kinase [Clostridia bacterium]
MLHIIGNETAGSGRGAKILHKVTAILDGMKTEYKLDLTKKAGDAERIAKDTLDKGDNEIVCVGGDGTVYEIVNGIAGRFAKLFFVPCGTGNDFVKTLGYPKDPIAAFKKQLEGSPELIDCGKVNDRYFLNISGGGFDVEVLKQASRFKKLGKGLVPYLLGIFAALKKFKGMSVEMTLDGKTVKKDITIFSVGNGRYFGGGMKSVPHAIVDDGLFDLIIADKLGRAKILKLLSKFISGKHTELPCISETRCKEFELSCPGMTVELDGELVQMDSVRYEIIPKAFE